MLIVGLLEILVYRILICVVIALIIWCRKRTEEKKLQKYLEIVIKKYCSDKWDAKAPLGGFAFKSKNKLGKGGEIDSENRFLDGDHGSMKNLEHETGRDISHFQYDDNNENAMKLREDAEAKRLALIQKMRSTNNSNAFTETESKAKRRRRMLNDPDGVIDDMSNLNRPAFQRELTKDEIERILAENPEIAQEFDNERQRWLEYGEEDPNNVNPLSDYNTLLVAKMQKGYDNKADDLVDNFRNKDFNKKLAKIEEERLNELDDLELDKLEMQGKAVAFSNAEGVLVRKKIKKKKKGKKKGKVFILDTPYGRAKFYKRKPSPPPIEENNVMFQSQLNLDKKTRAKAKKLHSMGRKDSDVDKSGSSIVEADEVMFDTGFGPNKDIESDGDEMDEQDMVIYNKDDMTQFSKNLGINKMKSRLTLMNFRHSQERLSTGEFDENMEEDDEAQFDNANSPGPKRKLIQKNKDRKKKKKRKTKSISDNHSIKRREINAFAAGSVNSDFESNSEHDLTSEEDNPNDKSGLLSFVDGKKNNSKKKGKITKKNKWVSKNKDTEFLGRKSYIDTGNLSMILPRYKSQMRRSKLVRKKKLPKKVITTNGSPYEEYLPARFRDKTHEEMNNSKLSAREHRPRRELMEHKLPSEYIASPSVPLSTSKPPRSKQGKELNFYGSGQKLDHKRNNTGLSIDSMGTKSNLFNNQIILHDFNNRMVEQDDENSSESRNDEHQNIIFQRNNKVEPEKEDGEKRPPRDLLFSMNKEFHQNNEQLYTVNSKGDSNNGSRSGSKGRTYTSEKAVFSTIRM